MFFFSTAEWYSCYLVHATEITEQSTHRDASLQPLDFFKMREMLSVVYSEHKATIELVWLLRKEGVRWLHIAHLTWAVANLTTAQWRQHKAKCFCTSSKHEEQLLRPCYNHGRNGLKIYARRTCTCKHVGCCTLMECSTIHTIRGSASACLAATLLDLVANGSRGQLCSISWPWTTYHLGTTTKFTKL